MKQTTKLTPDDIVKRIMQEPVPAEGQLLHPIKSDAIKKKQEREEKKAINLEDAKNFKFPFDVNTWTPKIFVDYFASKYSTETGGVYRRVYRSDIMIVQQIGDFLVSNGLERNLWTKKFIDWGFKNREEILKRERHFTLQEVIHQINYFYQREILPKVEEDEIERDTQDTVLLEEIQKADESGKITEVFIRFGIPVAVTYLVNFRNIDEAKILKATKDRISALFGGSSVERNQLGKIFQSSIIGSPYPPEFLASDWRERFEAYVVPFKKENWWRDDDYKGKPLPKYYSLI